MEKVAKDADKLEYQTIGESLEEEHQDEHVNEESEEGSRPKQSTQTAVGGKEEKDKNQSSGREDKRTETSTRKASQKSCQGGF